jgi:hypothetical protein
MRTPAFGQPASGGVTPWKKIHEIASSGVGHDDPFAGNGRRSSDMNVRELSPGLGRCHRLTGAASGTVIRPSPWLGSPRRRFVAL